MGQESYQEKRKYPRLKAAVDVKYTVIGKPGEIKVFSQDISAGGLCIITEEQLVADTPLQLKIRIPDLKDPIAALARVVWQQKGEAGGERAKEYFKTGIEFTGISDFDRFNINRYITEQIDLKGKITF